jgi:hypothetical protein
MRTQQIGALNGFASVQLAIKWSEHAGGTADGNINDKGIIPCGSDRRSYHTTLQWERKHFIE